MTKRRSVIKSAGLVVAGGIGGASMVSENPQNTQPLSNTSGTGSKTIDVKLFASEELLTSYGEEVLTQGKDFVETYIPKLSSMDMLVNVNVSISDRSFSETELPLNKERSDDLQRFRDKLFVGDSLGSPASDSNVLLTMSSGPNNGGGYGELPDSPEPSVSIVYSAGKLAQTPTYPKPMHRTLRSETGKTLVHEIGHNIGLDHTQGYAWEYEQDVYTTFMINPSKIEYGEENEYGQEYPREEEHDSTESLLQWNPRITPSDLVVT